MTRLALAVLLIGLAAAPAFAEPPAGFLEFAWGTPPAVIRERFVPTRCRSSTEDRRNWYSIQCNGYLVEGQSILLLRLDFEPADSLAGYYMVVTRGSYRAFRDVVLQRFGRPTSRSSNPWSGGHMSWTWDAVSAILIERCGEDSSCMEVRTPALEQKREQIRERERRDAAQSF